MPKFGWKAVYEDGIIKQYPHGKPETNFGEVRTKGLPLKFFIGRKYGVNLLTGELLIDGRWREFGDADAVPLKPLELIYFRRNLATINKADMHEVGSRQIRHFVGYEHAAGIVRLCIPDDGNSITICIGA